jgi:hypothetical protein
MVRTATPAHWMWAGGDPPTCGPHHTATLLPEGAVIVIGTCMLDGAPAHALRFDPQEATWSRLRDPPIARTGFSATLLQSGRILVSGGENASGDVLASAELFDPVRGSWSSAPSMRTPRVGHTATAFAHGSRVLVSGGFTRHQPQSEEDEPTASLETYEVASGSWSTLGALRMPRAEHTATAVDDGDIFLVGGVGTGRIRTDYTELLEIAGSALGSVSVPSPGLSGHVAIALGTDSPPTPVLLEVLVVAFDGWRSGAAVYESESARWIETGPMHSPGLGHLATLLPDGRVLVLLGDPYNPAAPFSEIFGVDRTWTLGPRQRQPYLGGSLTRLLDGSLLAIDGKAEILTGAL